jgi:hypothetical protein
MPVSRNRDIATILGRSEAANASNTALGTGSGGGGGGATSYASVANFPSSGNTAGDFAWATDDGTLHTWDGSSWKKVYVGPDEILTWTTEANSNYTLGYDSAIADSATITVLANDADGYDVVYDYDTNPTNQTTVTVTNNQDGTYKIVGSTDSADIGRITFRATANDGVHKISSAAIILLGLGKTADAPASSIAELRDATTSDGMYWFDTQNSGVPWKAYVKFNYTDGNDWMLLMKVHNSTDMPSGSSYWTNTTLNNENDANLTSGNWAKYATWNNFDFNYLMMEMHDGGTAKFPPIMYYSTARTFAEAITATGGASVYNNTLKCESTTPVFSTPRYHEAAFEYNGNAFTDIGGSEDYVQAYGIGMWANNASNDTLGGTSTGIAGAWIGCPLDQTAHTGGFNADTNGGSDSGFGFGFAAGNSARTGSAGYAEWGNATRHTLPGYVWVRAA